MNFATASAVELSYLLFENEAKATPPCISSDLTSFQQPGQFDTG
jgi:hypothetical protein